MELFILNFIPNLQVEELDISYYNEFGLCNGLNDRYDYRLSHGNLQLFLLNSYTMKRLKKLRIDNSHLEIYEPIYIRGMKSLSNTFTLQLYGYTGLWDLGKLYYPLSSNGSLRHNFFSEAAKFQPSLSKLTWVREGCLDNIQMAGKSDAIMKKLIPFQTLDEFYKILYSIPPGQKVNILAADTAFTMNEISFSGWVFNASQADTQYSFNYNFVQSYFDIKFAADFGMNYNSICLQGRTDVNYDIFRGPDHAKQSCTEAPICFKYGRKYHLYFFEGHPVPDYHMLNADDFGPSIVNNYTYDTYTYFFYKFVEPDIDYYNLRTNPLSFLLSRFQNLTHLSLSGSYLDKMPVMIFPNTTAVRQLSSSRLSLVPRMRSLEHLNVSYNDITVITASVSTLSNLQVLDASENPLVLIRDLYLPKLTCLLLGTSKMKYNAYNVSLPSLAIADLRGIEGNFDGFDVSRDKLQRVCVSPNKISECISRFSSQVCTASDSCYECKGTL
jgi:hypothetical protein